MRTESEMHDLVVAKVAAHRRRRTLLASAGGGVAAVLLLVAVAAGAAGSGPDEGVRAGEGEPTTTTEAPTTTEPADGTTTTTAVPPPPTAPAPSTTEAPPSTTTEPPATTTEPPPTTTTTTTPEPVQPASTVVTRRDGDMDVTFTVTTDPARPGVVAIRIQVTDPTGIDLHGTDYRNGPGGSIGHRTATYEHLAWYGDVVASCGHGDLEASAPADFDETVEVTVPSGPQTLALNAGTLACHVESNEVYVDADVLVP